MRNGILSDAGSSVTVQQIIKNELAHQLIIFLSLENSGAGRGCMEALDDIKLYP